MYDKKHSRDHSILDRGIKNTKGLSFTQSVLLRFCFLLDFFQINNFFEIYETKNPLTYSTYHNDVGYNRKRCINEYKKYFFNDSTRTSNANCMSETLVPFWIFFKSLLNEPSFNDSLQNCIQKRILVDIKDKLKSSETFLDELIKDCDLFITFIGGQIVKFDENRTDYNEQLAFQERMSEKYGDDYSPYEIPLPERLFFEELYDDEISKYDIYRALINNIPAFSSNSTRFTFSKEMIEKDISFWNLVLQNWNILLLFFNNNVIWDSYISSRIFLTYSNDKLDILLSDMLNNSSTLSCAIIKRAEEYFYILNYNFSPRKRKVDEIYNMITKKVTSYKLSLFLYFCYNNDYEIKELDSSSIKYLYRLFILT